MKKSIFLLLVSIAPSLLAGDSDKIKVCKFQWDKAAAVSFTFDDGSRDHLTVGLPLFEKYGFKGTFYLVINRTDKASKFKASGRKPGKVTWDEWKIFIEKGHEVGNHSMTHYQLTKDTLEKAEKEINDPIPIFKEKLGIEPETFCYPGNARNQAIRELVLKNHIAATEKRLVYGGENFTAERGDKWLDNAIENRQWMVPMLHAIEQGSGYKPFSSVDVFENHLKYLKSKENKVWIDTFANVAKYVKERDQAQLAVTDSSANSATIVLKSNLDPKKYNIPLTVEIPAKVQKATCVQSGKNNAVKIENDRILVQIKPNGEPATVNWE